MDDRDREKLYSAPEPADDDDLELELEPPDTAADERRKQATMASIAARIDIDEVYREADHDRGGEIMENWLRNFRFRFQVKHLLIATAVIAIALTLAKFQLFWTALIVLVMLSVFGLYVYIQTQERKHQAEVDRKRDALFCALLRSTGRADFWACSRLAGAGCGRASHSSAGVERIRRSGA